MNVIVTRADFVALIAKMQNVIPTKPSTPILINVLLEASDGQLIMSASDLMLSLRASIDAKVEQPGGIALPARRLFQLVRELTAPYVEISTNTAEIACVRAGSSHFKIHGLHREEYPEFPQLSGGTSFSTPSHVLKQHLTRTVFSVAKEDQHHNILNGLLMQCQNGQVTFVGTDGKRLAQATMTTDLPLDHTSQAVIPVKAVDEMVHLLDDKDENTLAKITFTQDKLAMETERTFFVTKLLIGQFPDVERIIPARSEERALSLHREELMSLLRQIALFAPDASSPVRFTFEHGELRVASASGDIGEGRVSMAVNYDRAPLDIAFNPHFFLDILRHSDDEAVRFDISDSYNPGLVTDSTDALFVLMPMRLEV